MAYKVEITGDLRLNYISKGGVAEKIKAILEAEEQEDLNLLVENDKIVICSDEFLWCKTALNNIKHESVMRIK